jgi:hypothetical protein
MADGGVWAIGRSPEAPSLWLRGVADVGDEPTKKFKKQAAKDEQDAADKAAEKAKAVRAQRVDYPVWLPLERGRSHNHMALHAAPAAYRPLRAHLRLCPSPLHPSPLLGSARCCLPRLPLSHSLSHTSLIFLAARPAGLAAPPAPAARRGRPGRHPPPRARHGRLAALVRAVHVLQRQEHAHVRGLLARRLARAG